MGIYAALVALLGRHAELSEYAEKIEAELGSLARRVEALEVPAGGTGLHRAEDTPELPTSAADDAAATAS